ncbi:MAG: ABC transporter permease [Ilumatobacteraceae bacterium]|nr:ABC transporter permease [Ilumatobacteraceae bacterium]
MTATLERSVAPSATSSARLGASRLRPVDVAAVATDGLRQRKMRTALSALGITIGIAAMVAVLGLSESSRADLSNQIEELGTNLLTIEPSGGFGGGDGVLPEEAVAKLGRIGPIEVVADVVALDELPLRNDVMSVNETKGLTAIAADVDLVSTLRGSVAAGDWLDGTSAETPSVVLGSVAAERLAITSVADGPMITIGGEWFTVVGILDEFPLAESYDRAVFIGKPVAQSTFDVELNASTIYVRTEPDQLDAVRGVISATVDPQSPDEVSISRPSDVLEAQEAADSAFTSLFLGLGAVALLVGGIGIANVMVIAVIERRNEIGLRRALGATRAHIRRQFLVEALLLSSLGGVAGVSLGAAVTAFYADIEGWGVVIPTIALVGGLVAALAIGVIAGLYPAMRAARLAPTEALRSA